MDAPTSWDDPRLRDLLDQLCRSARIDRRVQTREDTDDVRSEVHLKLAKTPPLVDKPIQVWEKYLREVVRTTVVEIHRRQTAGKRDATREVREEHLSGGDSSGSTPRLGGILPGQDTSPSGRAIKQEQLDHLNVEIDRLPPAQQQAIRLQLQGFGPTRIAQEMGRTTDAVTALLSRATVALSEVLLRLNSEPEV